MEKPIRTRTYNNFMRAMKIIIAKGYDEQTAADIVRKQFDEMEIQQYLYGKENTMPLQFYLEKIIDISKKHLTNTT